MLYLLKFYNEIDWNGNELHQKRAKPIPFELPPIVRHHLTVGGAVFLWLNLLPKINYKQLSVT